MLRGLVPEGRWNLAQRFIAGYARTLDVFSPVGTDEVLTVNRPYGTRGLLIALYPALKCGAKIARPYGAKKLPLVVENDPTHVFDVHGSTPLDLCESFDAISW